MAKCVGHDGRIPTGGLSCQRNTTPMEARSPTHSKEMASLVFIKKKRRHLMQGACGKIPSVRITPPGVDLLLAAT